MPAFLQSGHFFPPLAERNEEWRESRDSGATFSTAPAPYEDAQVIGAPNGRQRFDTTYTIPSTANGTYSVTVQGDIFAGEVNDPAHVFLDGVDQGAVVSGGGDLHGPKTFTFPSIPGVHTFSLRIGFSAIAGITAPHIGVTYNATQPCCCILNPSPPGQCFKSNNFACFPVSCSDGIKWYFDDGVQLTPDDLAHVVDCRSGMQGLRMIGRSVPAAGFCNISPAPSHVDGLTLVGSCWTVNAGVITPVMEWDGPVTSVDITTAVIPAGGGGTVSFALANLQQTVSTVPNPIIWPSNLVPMVVGETRLSNPLPNGHRVALVYVAGPNNTNAPRTNNPTSITVGQEWGYRLGIINTDQMHFRLIYI